MASDPSTTLQLVPETLLKRRNDLEQLKARRAAAAISNPLQPRKRSIANNKDGSKKVVRIVKPETILIQARHRRNYDTRYKRVQKKGMQKRAVNKSLQKVKVWDAEREEEVEDKELERQRERLAAEAAAAAAAAAAQDSESESDDEDDDDDEEKDNDKKAKEQAAVVKEPTIQDVIQNANYQKIPYKANSIGASTVFAILLRPTLHTTPKAVRKTLSSLRLRRVREGVFLPYTESVRKMLHLVEPYVLYGVPSLETISDLVRRRGFCRIDGKRVPLADNNIIERELGEECGLICVEDLVQVLSTGGLDGVAEMSGGDGAGKEGSTFFKVAKFLWPFRLTSRKSKFQKKMLDLKDGKLYGDQGEAMNGYIREML